jgi:hypothetical protein
MTPLNSRAVPENLESYAGQLLAESAFFSALAAGQARPGDVRDVFGQYYLWRNRYHRWFGLCVAKSAPCDEALAALAGRGLAGPSCNRVITGALPRHYGVTAGLEFFGRPGEEEAGHFRAMWQAIVRDRTADTGRLIEAARLEIWEHVTFWDDVCYATLGTENELAS